MAGTVQFWGLGSGMNNISEIVDALVLNDKVKLTAYENKSKIATNKKNAWNELKSSINSINDKIKDLTGINRKSFKGASISEEGFLSVTTKDIALNKDYSISVEQLAQKHRVIGNKVENSKSALGLSGSFSINNTSISISETDTLSTIMEKINSAKDSEGKSIGAKAYIIDGVLNIESENTGVKNSIKFGDDSGVLSSLGIIKQDGSVNTKVEAKNSLMTINGIQVERESNVIDDAISGVSINLTKVTDKELTLSIKNDTERIKNMISEFVDELNGLFNKMAKYTSYDSSTNSSGILNGDSSIRSIKSSISSVLQSNFSGGDFGFLFEIGISIDRYGKINIDDTKLDNALNSNPDGVLDLFTRGLNERDTSTKGKGVLLTLKEKINELTDSSNNIFSAKADSLDRQIKMYDNLISKQKSYIEKRKEMLESQFRAMEQTINSLNSQSNLITNMNNLNSKDK